MNNEHGLGCDCWLPSTALVGTSPLHARGEAGAATPTDAACLDLADQPLRPLGYQVGRAIPVSTFACSM